MTGDEGGLAGRIRQGAETLEVEVSEEALLKIGRYLEELDRWRHRINLVGPGSMEELLDRHVYDSLGVLRLLDLPEVQERTQRWLDVGTGAGLPGVICALARPSSSWVLVEPLGKRVSWLKHITGTLEMDNVTVEHSRLEDLQPRRWPGLVSRATFAPERWASVGRDHAEDNGLVLVTMGGTPSEDVLKGAWRVDRFTLPASGAGRVNALLAG
ncbi:MAG: 16S rRNA (guanine(527)-N(7))-methyltransferase RsmG [Myxococcota bacterium]|nr:16S rRNA (guanine(527)-N(7))-methyltransferase RsmG [Myxococcota bacterium]